MKIKAVAMDVDGVLTDGAFWWGPNGEEFKRFTFLDIMGVAIARRTLLNDELERGTLIVPFGLAVPNHKRYVLLYAPGALNHPGVRAVHDWLVEEARIFRSLHPLGEGQL